METKIDKKEYNNFNKFCQNIKKFNKYSDVINYFNICKGNIDNNMEYKLIKSALNSNLYVEKINEIEFFVYIKLLTGLKYRDDAQQFVDEIMRITNDPAQVNTLNRILEKKPYKLNNILISNNNKNYEVTKPCPHCGNIYKANINKEYVICGYTSKGFDWYGCGYDWCFQCGKMLCKCWNIDQLFNRENRFHNNKCCKNDAKQSEYDYMADYCHCKRNRYVRR